MTGSQSKRCPAGHEVPADVIFCGICGQKGEATPLSAEEQALRQRDAAWDPRSPRRGSGRKRVIAMASAALLILVAITAAKLTTGTDPVERTAATQSQDGELEPGALTFPADGNPEAPAWQEGYQEGAELDDVATRAAAEDRCDAVARRAYGETSRGAGRQLVIGCLIGWIAIQKDG